MTAREPGRWGRWLIALLAGGHLPELLAGPVRARVARDPEWAIAYDVLRRAERAAEGAGALSSGQRRAIERAVLAGATPAQGRAPALLLGGLATAMAAVVVAVVIVDRPDPVVDTFAARGTEGGALGFKVRCVEGGASPRVLGEAVGTEGLTGRLSCTSGALLAFSLTNLRGADRQAFIVGVDARGELRWYAPFSESSRSMRIADGAVDEVLPVLADPSGMTSAGPVTVFALFSDEVIDGGGIRRALEGARGRGLAVGAMERLPVAAREQARVELVVEGTRR